jgi:hypothetical protein
LPEHATRVVAWIAIAAAAIGVVSTWTTDRPVRLDGLQGPNNGWLVLIAAALALAWTPSMARGSWIGVVGVFGAALVMGGTAVENWLDSRDVLGARASYGLLLFVAASIALAGAAVASVVVRRRTARELRPGRDAGSRA